MEALANLSLPKYNLRSLTECGRVVLNRLAPHLFGTYASSGYYFDALGSSLACASGSPTRIFCQP